MHKRGIFLVLLLFISSVSASGFIIDPSSLNITKTANEDYYLTLNIKNTQTFEFKNIQFLDTIKANQFNLLPGENKTVNFKIDSNDNTNKIVKLRGYYESVLGESNKTELVNIYYDSSGVDKCNLNLVAGDSIKWKNNVPGDVKIRNTDTNQDIKVLSSNEEYIIKFNQAQSFNYQISRIGIPFTDICNINVMSTSGLIYNTDFDSLVTLNLTVSYPSTNISSFFLQDNYNLSYNEQYQDVFSIRNNGNLIAKNVKLSADWITFDKNNFDIEPGKSVNVGYTVKPIIYETAQTNQMYTSTIKISGNFEEINKNISIFVKYANIGSGIGNISALDPTVLMYLLDKICQDHPEFEKCKISTTCGNSTTKEVSAIFTEDTIFELIKSTAESGDKEDIFRNQQNELISNLTSTLSGINQEMNLLREENKQLKEDVGGVNSTTLFLGIMFMAIVVIGGFTYLILKNKGKIKIFSLGNFHKGEKPF